MPKQDVSFQIFTDGAWRDITADDDVFTAPIVIQRGQGDESPAPRPAQLTAQLANDDDRYRTSNPVGPLYGKAGRSTPAQVLIGESVRGVVEASSWECDETSDFRRYPRRGRAWTDFTGGGRLQRVNQWTQPLKSPFRQYNESLAHTIGYFPAEQARGSTKLLSTVPGTSDEGIGGGFTGFAFDSQHKPLGSAPLMDVGENAALGIYFNRATASATATAGWQLSWAARYEPLGTGSLRTIMNWRAADGHGYRLDLLPDTGEINLISTVLDTTVSYGTYDWGQWTLFSIDAQYSAPNTTVWVNWTNADNSESGFFNASFADVPASLVWWSVLGEADEIPAGSTMGHIMGVDVASTGGVNLYDSNRIDAWTGYLDELSAERFARLCNLFNIDDYESSGYLQSARMGPQPVAPLSEQFREIAETDDGLIFDYRDESRIFFLCRVDRYNQTPALDLTPTDLPGRPRGFTDNLPVHNLITVSQRGGGEATAEDSTGPLGTQPPPDGAGEWRQDVNVNVADEAAMLTQLANWWLRRGTVNQERFPLVTVNLAALTPDKVAEVEAVDVGDVITLTGFREDVIRVHVLGYTETIGWPIYRRITFVCAPDQQFDVGTYDDAEHLYDSGSTTLASAPSSATFGTLALSTADRLDVWSTTSEPYDIMVAGERMTVTSMGGVTGTGPYLQSANVQRSRNGVAKIPPAGSPVHVYRPGRYAIPTD